MIKNVHRCVLLDEQYNGEWIFKATRRVIMGIGLVLVGFSFWFDHMASQNEYLTEHNTTGLMPMLIGIIFVIGSRVVGSTRRL